MSNQIRLNRIVFIVFTSLNGIRTNKSTYGFTLTDTQHSVMCNDLTEFPDSNYELLQVVCNQRCENDAIDGILKKIVTNQLGIFIDDEWVEYKDIKPIISKPNPQAKALIEALKLKAKESL